MPLIKVKCKDCIFCDYFLVEDKYWCHEKKMYVDPEQLQCEKFKPQIGRIL